MSRPIVIQPTAVFSHPQRVIAGRIISAPDVFPKDIEMQLFLHSGGVKRIVLHRSITTSPEALRDNLHGFVFSGDDVDEQDLQGDVLASNGTRFDAYETYRAYQRRN